MVSQASVGVIVSGKRGTILADGVQLAVSIIGVGVVVRGVGGMDCQLLTFSNADEFESIQSLVVTIVLVSVKYGPSS